MTRNQGLVEERITLSYGAGGNAMRSLIEQIFVPGFARIDGIGLEAMDDGAALRLGDQWLVITTDSHVVHPIEFPGGDIGRLAIAGTVNDLAMMGVTTPLALTSAVVIEEGFQRVVLERIWASMRAACESAGTTIVTGDTKVMGKGEIDGIVINTTGVGLTRRVVPDSGLSAGDRILVTGSMGDHGLAIMAARNQLDLEAPIFSDVAPLNDLVRRVLEVGGEGVVALKDPTRGGLSSALHEMAEKSGVGMLIDEPAIPVRREVRAVAELLGIDPLLVANEGKAVIGLSANVADAVLDAVRSHPLGRDAALIGECVSEKPGRVVLDTGFGRRLLSEPDGVLLPRIC
ncbi:MAG: hydrogenase expression/formation protein HypE [Myxococcales bacterium]|nr:hydrogenase expression/formation protein HypE [Myxococcales bacterium]